MRVALKIGVGWLVISVVVLAVGLYLKPVKPRVDQAVLLRNTSHQIAAPQAKITVVYFVDYVCEACAYSQKLVKRLLADYHGKINFVLRQYPIESHKNSFTASLVVESAGAQGKFWEMHEALLERQKDWVDASDPMPIFLDIAKNLNLNAAKLRKDVENKQGEESVNGDIADAESLGVKGAPSIFIDGKNEGYIETYSELSKKVDRVLAKAQKNISTSVSTPVVSIASATFLTNWQSAMEEELERIEEYESDPIILFLLFIILLLGGVWTAINISLARSEAANRMRKRVVEKYKKYIDMGK